MAPARRQVDQATLDEYLRERRPEGGTYNIWHSRWKGLERDWSKKGCDVARDSGETAGSTNPNAYFCLFFAKGMCVQGAKCSMWHRIPNDNDEMETTIDCFGRDKYTEFRQDMGGVGSFNSQNKTLYVGRVAPTDDMEQVVRKHFGAFGEIERIRLLEHRGVAFVTYKNRMNAEFAREAMMNQSLDNNEILNVRWATVDSKALPGNDKQKRKDEKEEADEVVDQEELERQYYESELPVEYTRTKRELDEDGLQQVESDAKRIKAETEELYTGYYPNTESEMSTYGYAQPQAYQAYPVNVPNNQTTQPTQTPQKAGGIIPQNVLQSLKKLSRTDQSPQPAKSKPAGGLSTLANYGSDSEEEDED